MKWYEDTSSEVAGGEVADGLIDLTITNDMRLDIVRKRNVFIKSLNDATDKFKSELERILPGSDRPSWKQHYSPFDDIDVLRCDIKSIERSIGNYIRQNLDLDELAERYEEDAV